MSLPQRAFRFTHHSECPLEAVACCLRFISTFVQHDYNIRYDPVKDIGRKETLNASKALRRRYYMVQVAKDAKTVGILAGTLGVVSLLKEGEHCDGYIL